VSVYVSYTDETESPDQRSGKFLISGYMADETKWPEFSKRWAKEVTIATPKIPHLHMVDIRSAGWRQKHGITRVQADEKVRRAVDIIADTDFIAGYITQVSEQVYLGALKILDDAGVRSKKNHNRIDYICFIAYSLALVTKIANEMPDVRKIIFAISKKQTVSHHLSHGLYDAMVDELRILSPKLGELFGEVLPLDMEHHMPLQAADVLCWHLQRTAKVDEQDSEVRRNMAVLQQKELYAIDVPDSALITLAKNLVRQLKDEED
jgi:hypothetical protein